MTVEPTVAAQRAADRQQTVADWFAYLRGQLEHGWPAVDSPDVEDPAL